MDHEPKRLTGNDVQVTEDQLLSMYGLAIARLEISLRTIEQMRMQNHQLQHQLEEALAGKD